GKSKVANIFFRPSPSLIAVSINNIKNDVELVINKPVTLNYLDFVKNLRSARVKTAEINFANHNSNGDITELISDKDNTYAELFPGEYMDFSFRVNKKSDKTKYFLCTIGRYETDSSYFNSNSQIASNQEISQPISEYKLFENFPNPFNPSTIISYQIPNDGMVTLKIYDILGREV
ncbi:MAG: hypothetical protein K8H86_05210, partial [Ignavibacteriaceae bacterium]|nr:hypothetical protein [Ignavibacteriaceae bacterium]